MRTSLGIIGKFIRIEYDEVDKHLKWYVLDKGVFDLSYTNKPYIVKHSFNIIDLIEAGDYVNGSKVVDVMEDIKTGELHLEMTYNYTNEEKGDCTIYNKDIKTILTKEQFKAMQYEV